jgi:hypothetical protein
MPSDNVVSTMAQPPTVDGLVKEAVKRCKERIRSGERAKPDHNIGSSLKKKWL